MTILNDIKTIGKKEYDLLMNDYLNILKQNFELQVQLSEDDDIQLVRDRKV